MNMIYIQHVCVYIYTHYVCVYIYICIYIDVYIYIDIDTYIHAIYNVCHDILHVDVYVVCNLPRTPTA